MQTEQIYFPSLENVKTASENLKGVAIQTPLSKNFHLSKELGATILFKREDLQVVRSYKIRGAYNKMSSLSDDEKQRGIVCASAGNHAQGVALSCKLLQIKGTIYMPSPTPNQKIGQVNVWRRFY
jgi:threonine dehydratase